MKAKIIRCSPDHFLSDDEAYFAELLQVFTTLYRFFSARATFAKFCKFSHVFSSSYFILHARSAVDLYRRQQSGRRRLGAGRSHCADANIQFSLSLSLSLLVSSRLAHFIIFRLSAFTCRRRRYTATAVVVSSSLILMTSCQPGARPTPARARVYIRLGMRPPINLVNAFAKLMTITVNVCAQYGSQ